MTLNIRALVMGMLETASWSEKIRRFYFVRDISIIDIVIIL